MFVCVSVYVCLDVAEVVVWFMCLGMCTNSIFFFDTNKLWFKRATLCRECDI